MDERRGSARSTAPPQLDREPDYYSGTTPCWRLADGRTVIGTGRRQIVIKPPVYVAVPAEEQEAWEQKLKEVLVDLLMMRLERRAAEEAGLLHLYQRPKRKQRNRSHS